MSRIVNARIWSRLGSPELWMFALKKTIELYHSTTYFAVFSISIQIFYNVTETTDRVHVTKFIV